MGEHDWGRSLGGAYLVCYYRSARCSGICCYYDAAIEEAADDCGSGTCGFGERDALGVEGEVAVVVAEVEARHCESSDSLIRGVRGVYGGRDG